MDPETDPELVLAVPIPPLLLAAAVALVELPELLVFVPPEVAPCELLLDSAAPVVPDAALVAVPVKPVLELVPLLPLQPTKSDTTAESESLRMD